MPDRAGGDGAVRQDRPLRGSSIKTDFGIAGLAGPVVRQLYELCIRDGGQTNGSPLEKWRQKQTQSLDFDGLYGDRAARALASHYELDAPEPAVLLFAVHTYFALCIKLVLRTVLDGRLADRPDVRDHCRRLEDPEEWVQRGLSNFVSDNLFSWYLDRWTPALAEAIGTLISRFRTYDAHPCEGAQHSDLLRALYLDLIPAAVRHDLGEYYTPDWLAELTLDEVGLDGNPEQTVVDPACGSGIYLIAALRRMKHPLDDSPAGGRQIVDRVRGFDLNPLAVMACRANYAVCIRQFLDPDDPVEIPVYRRDALSPETAFSAGDGVDFVVGNPPWVNWQNLPPSQREELMPRWESYGLFSLSGRQARLGGGKKDLSMLFTYVCCDQYLADGGRLGFLITHSVFKSKGAGDGFRRFRYPDGDRTVYLEPEVVHDFTDFQPFPGATTQTALLCLRKSTAPFDYPVPYRYWEKTGRGQIATDASLEDAHRQMRPVQRAATPVDDDHPSSPWLTASPKVLDGVARVIGDSEYRAYEGVNSGGLNGCYWVREIQRTLDGFTVIENLADVGRIKVDRVRTEVETDRVFPLLRSGDVDRWRAAPKHSILLAQDPHSRSGIAESKMKREFPKTYAYFRQFEGDPEDVQRGTLRGRSLFRRYYKPTDPFYSMYGVGPYTMSEWKVCWLRIDTRLRAVVVGPTDDGRVVLPQETITFVPTSDAREAHYFCALFNSAPSDALVRHYSTGKGFASAHVLDMIAIPEFDPDNSVHRRLSELSQSCHDAARRGEQGALPPLQHRVDRHAATVWNLSDSLLEAIRDDLHPE